MSRLIFRAHPDMVRGAWVRGRRLNGPGPPRNGGSLVTEHSRPADQRRDPRRRDRRAGPTRNDRVVDGRIRLLDAAEPLPENVGRRIDATSKVVAPGFIDLHSHGGLMILADGRHEPKVRQGVTTELVGVDGNGFAPFERREDLEAFVELDSGLDGRPAIDYDWTSVASYLGRYDATVQPQRRDPGRNSQLRIAALGWRTSRPMRRPSPGCAGCSPTRWPMERSGSARARLPARRLRDDRGARRADRGGRPQRRLLPHPRPIPARRPLPRPVPRGDRDRPARRGAGSHHPLLPS
jgi:hypothetical protein